MKDGLYPPKWQKRFEFFKVHGAPNTREARLALKAEATGVRNLITHNYFAFFFGIIYFFTLGIYKRGLTLLAISAGIGLGFGILGGCLFALVALFSKSGVDLSIVVIDSSIGGIVTGLLGSMGLLVGFPAFVIISVIGGGKSLGIGSAIVLVTSSLFSTSANYAYYLKKSGDLEGKNDLSSPISSPPPSSP